jgi:HSP20 family protein
VLKKTRKIKNNSLNKGDIQHMTTTLIPGHYASTERVLSRLPDLFNDNWLSNSVDDWAKALDVPNAVYPYNIKLLKDKNDQDKQYEIEVALAGVGKENIEIKVRDGLLHIEVAKSETGAEDSGTCLRKGISHRSGKLSFSLGEKVQKKKISSSYSDGLLRVVVPLTQPEILDIDVKVM